MENATKIVCGGNNYLIVHLYDDCFYGRKSVYNVLTNNQKWCGSLIPELCGYNNVDSEGIHNMNYKRNPTIINALKPYYKVDFIEDNFYQTVDLNIKILNRNKIWSIRELMESLQFDKAYVKELNNWESKTFEDNKNRNIEN